MAHIEISGFKMLEKAPYELQDHIAITKLIINGIRDEEKIYGPAFTAMFIRYALRAAAKQIGEEPREDIKTLDQLEDYLFSKVDIIRPCYIVLWAQFVTVKKFEGYQGVGERVMEVGVSQRVMNITSEVKKFDIDDVISKLYQTLVEIKVAPCEWGYKKNEDGSVDILCRGCYFMEGCRLSLNEALLHRPNGRMLCGTFALTCYFLKKSTGHEWDYTILEFDKPHCIAKCYMI